MKQKLKIRNITSITVLNSIEIQSLDFSEYRLIDYPNLNDFRLFILNLPKRKQKKCIFCNFSFLTG